MLKHLGHDFGVATSVATIRSVGGFAPYIDGALPPRRR